MMTGWKTWTAAALAVGYGVGGYALGLHDQGEMMRLIIYGAGLVGIGHKIEKIGSDGGA
jgi:hypothetical protein